MSDFIIIKWIVNSYRFIFWLSRKFGLADFIALIVINVIALIGLVIGITITSQNLLEFLDITGLDYQNHLKWL